MEISQMSNKKMDKLWYLHMMVTIFEKAKASASLSSMDESHGTPSERNQTQNNTQYMIPFI